MRRTWVMVAALGFVAGTAQAQSERVRVVANAGAQAFPGSFGQRFTLTRNVESAPVTTDVSVATNGVFDAGVRVRVHRELSIGVVGFVASSRASGTIDAQVPHPFYFDQRRDVSGEVNGLTRKETGAHLELAVPLRRSDRGEVTLFGGPSYFNVEQELVTDLTYTESYPYDTAALDDTTSTAVKKGAPGFNLGLELARRVNRNAWVALMGRYSRGTVTLRAAEGNEVELHAGGVQLGVGLRLGF